MGEKQGGHGYFKLAKKGGLLFFSGTKIRYFLRYLHTLMDRPHRKFDMPNIFSHPLPKQ